MEEEKSKVEVASEGLTIFERFAEMVKKYGPFRIILYAILFVVFSYLAYVAAHPQAMFERYDRYVEEKHAQSSDYRMKSSPIVRSLLNQLALEMDADKAYVIEYHNGKGNPSGLQWQYGDMTFLNDAADYDVTGEYQNMSLVKYPLFYELYENGSWVGSREELSKIDRRFALRLEVNETQYVGMTTMYGSNLVEIGVLAVSFLDKEKCPDKNVIKRALIKYSTSIAPLLDGSNAGKK